MKSYNAALNWTLSDLQSWFAVYGLDKIEIVNRKLPRTASELLICGTPDIQRLASVFVERNSADWRIKQLLDGAYVEFTVDDLDEPTLTRFIVRFNSAFHAEDRGIVFRFEQWVYKLHGVMQLMLYSSIGKQMKGN
jgi:hypothetical protein